jgi:uncharacterized protein
MLMARKSASPRRRRGDTTQTPPGFELPGLFEPLSVAERDELAAYLASEDVPPGCMDISTLHGFLSALISGPAVLPAEWLPHALGAPTPLFSSTEQARRIFGLIVRFSNGIALQLRDDPLNFLPFLFSDPGRSDAGSVMPEPWCMGYVRGVTLRAQAWEPVTREPLLAGLFEAIATIASRDDEDPPPGTMLDNLMAHESMYLVLASATIVFYRRWQQEPEQPERRMVSTEFPFAVAGL